MATLPQHYCYNTKGNILENNFNEIQEEQNPLEEEEIKKAKIKSSDDHRMICHGHTPSTLLSQKLEPFPTIEEVSRKLVERRKHLP